MTLNVDTDVLNCFVCKCTPITSKTTAQKSRACVPTFLESWCKIVSYVYFMIVYFHTKHLYIYLQYFIFFSSNFCTKLERRLIESYHWIGKKKKAHLCDLNIRVKVHESNKLGLGRPKGCGFLLTNVWPLHHVLPLYLLSDLLCMFIPEDRPRLARSK